MRCQSLRPCRAHHARLLRAAARARASATKPATGMSSARAVGSRLAASIRAGYVGAERSQALAQHFAPLSERGLGDAFEQPAIARQRFGARHEPHHRGCDFRRRHEGRGVDVEQDARLAAPLRQDRQSAVGFRCPARRRCARPLRAGTSGRRSRTMAARLDAEPARPAAPWRCCRAGWRRCAPDRASKRGLRIERQARPRPRCRAGRDRARRSPASAAIARSSRSTAMTRAAPSASSARVSPPGPGPDLEHRDACRAVRRRARCVR